MNYLIGSLVALLLVFTANFGQYLNNQMTFGSVAVGGEYQSTTTKPYNGSSLTNLTVLKSESGTMGSVIITGAGAGVMTLYDATTTNSSLRTKAATTTLVSIPASAAAGTYTFDIQFYQGLIVELSGTVPTSTISWR
jgi:hypothetical protein